MELLIFGHASFTDSMLYIGTTIGKFHGISLKTGKKIWSFATENHQNFRLRYFKPDDSYRDDIHSVIKSNEQFLEMQCELGGFFSTPAISDNLIVISSTNGIIYCLRQ
jgi:outer membrane protein assembly factor BamB